MDCHCSRRTEVTLTVYPHDHDEKPEVHRLPHGRVWPEQAIVPGFGVGGKILTSTGQQ